MISLPNKTKVLASQPLAYDQRSRLIEMVVESYLDNMSGRDLERFFSDVQSDYLSEYSDEELLQAVGETVSAGNLEFQEFLNEIG